MDIPFLAWLVTCFILLAWLAFLTVSVRGLRRQHRVVSEMARRENLSDTILRFAEDMQSLRGRLEGLESAQREMADYLRSTIQKVGLVRFDAFEDVGGKLSFAVAFLDDHGDGVVVSSINGRQETRIYAKPIRKGESIYALSAEERGALARAMSKGV